MVSVLRAGRAAAPPQLPALLAVLGLLPGAALAAARPSAPEASSFRCEGSAADCAELTAGARWVEEYGSFVVFQSSSAQDAARGSTEERGRRAIRLRHEIHLGTFAFDPLLDDPAARWSRGAGSIRSEDRLEDHVVQFAAPIRQEWLDELRRSGLDLVQPVPNRAYLVRGDAAAIERARGASRVRAIAPLRAAHKLPRELLWAVGAEPRSNAPEFGRTVRASYDLAIARRAARAPIESAVASEGGEIVARLDLPSSFFDVLRVELPPSAVAVLAAISGVIRVDPYVPPTAEDERAAQIVAGNYTNATTIAAPGYDPATQFGVNGSGVTVAIADDGIGIPGDGGFYVTGANAVDAPLRGAPSGALGHGHLNATIVAGTTPFGALDPLSYNYGLGIAPGAHLVNIPILCVAPGYCSSTYTGTDADAANDAVATAGPNGAFASISNNSWGDGTNGNAYDSLAAAYDALARDASAAGTIDPLLFVFSAGNSGVNGLTRPKMAKNVIAVAASENLRSTLTTSGGSTGSANNLEEIPDFSSRGPAADGRIKPDLTAPGAAITGGRSGTSPLFGNIDAHHRHSTGTSHAAPQVAGAAALFTEQWKDAHAGASPSPAMIKAALINGAVAVTGAGATAPLPNGAEGWGRVHLANTLANPAPRVQLDEEVRLDAPGDREARTFEVALDAQPLRLTLVWSDPPALGDPALVNDLDLELHVGATVYRGNRFSAGVSVSGGDADRLNNVENIFLPAGTIAAGTSFTVLVVAAELPGDGALAEGDDTDQRYALVVSNAAPSTDAALRAEAPALAGETCVPANSALDPGETVELSLCLENLGTAPTGELVLTVAANASIQPIVAERSYGAVAPASEVCRTFVVGIAASVACGDPVPIEVEVTEATEARPGLVFSVVTGDVVEGGPATFTDSHQILIPSVGAAGTYPSGIEVSGLTGTIVDAELELHNVDHGNVQDVDLLLVAPDGTAARLFSDVAEGFPPSTVPITDLELVLDDQATAGFPYYGGFPSGTYHPADFSPGDAMPVGAPAANAPPELASFAGIVPNGTWSLYVADDTSGSSGKLQDGWSLVLRAGELVCAADCSLLFRDGFELGDTSRWSPTG